MLKPTEKTVMHSYPGMVALVTVEWNGVKNIMAAGWHSYISYDPPIYGVAIAKERYTYNLVTQSKQFAINFVPAEYAKIIQSSGVSTGKTTDKFKEFQLDYEPGINVKAPILSKAYVAYECEVIDQNTYGDHDWFVANITMFHKNQELFLDNGLPDFSKLHIPLYLGRSEYLIANEKTSMRTYHMTED